MTETQRDNDSHRKTMKKTQIIDAEKQRLREGARQGQLDSHPCINLIWPKIPKKQTAWKCRLDQYPLMILNPSEIRETEKDKNVECIY